jgi:membrane protein
MFAVLGVFVMTAILGIVVLGPLLGVGPAITERFWFGPALEVFWTMARWPAVFVVATGFLALLYRVGPNVRNRWRESLPGALFGTIGIVVVAASFRLYIEATGLQSPVIEDAGDAVALALQAVGFLMAWLFWMWLSTIAVLTGAVVNAELGRMER